ncbi:hypothetical protein L0Z31_09330 [Burkholderia vietnamiensis]|uniref:hypothetical protein n=1 Tax=Burkholderia cepacia complex TaxID=87882 RepID=UPI000756CB8F|nr:MULTISPECIES: hypothetical protein [Burkholderia cepacia complex]KVS12759.1 hypothetical protein WK32_32735 [Burkholderia vietnamiensis]MBU9658345.1 hypothetical protein [Burkholderia cenocepacia]MCO1351645.1 hypothetical protein [Burkholderia vietnamiensis]MCO1430163.1 hypothetical protein [Burkholderia vietnamiensis]UQN50934.1 hypothetical protein L0Y95_29285 [Burkholderia vietnamiensis]
MTFPEIRHVREYIVSCSRLMPLDAHDRVTIDSFRDGVDMVLSAVRNGETAVGDANGLTPLQHLQSFIVRTYIELHDDELRDLLHAQWNWLIEKGVLQ